MLDNHCYQCQPAQHTFGMRWDIMGSLFTLQRMCLTMSGNEIEKQKHISFTTLSCIGKKDCVCYQSTDYPAITTNRVH